MQTEAHARSTRSSETAEILEAVGALRDHIRSMDAQLKQLQSERARLTAEVDELRGRRGEVDELPSLRGEPSWKTEANRVTSELDQLVRMYESATRRRERPRSERALAAPSSAAPEDSGARLKRMFMLMMMSDLI